jgi:hypothetical protein
MNHSEILLKPKVCKPPRLFWNIIDSRRKRGILAIGIGPSHPFNNNELDSRPHYCGHEGCNAYGKSMNTTLIKNNPGTKLLFVNIATAGWCGAVYGSFQLILTAAAARA